MIDVPDRPRRLAAWVLPIFLAAALSAATTVPWGSEAGTSREAAVFEAVLRNLQNAYVEEVEVEPLAWRGLDDMVRRVDPYNRYVPPGEFSGFMHRNEGIYGGIGVVFRIEQNIPVVTAVVTDGPAARAGVRRGDRILAVGGAPTEDMDRERILQAIRGLQGSLVELRVAGPGEAPRTVVLERQDIQIPSVFGARILDPDRGIGLVRMSQFQNRTADEFADALRNLRAAGMASLILDLRDNTGGFLEEAIRVANLLIPEGVIVSTRGRKEASEARRYEAKPDAAFPPPIFPLVILIDGNTASAAEIVAGAVQDSAHRRGVLVGSRSYGKGSVQTIFPLLGDPERYGAVKLTTRRYYTPSGRSLSPTAESEGGLVPDAVVPAPADFPERYAEWIDRELLRRIDAPTAVIADDPLDIASDPALSEAVALLRDPSRYEEVLHRTPPGPEPRRPREEPPE
ncbi:MAG: S41 family peptidase [Planctomycetes bacterium]|nr:S41 family peptidase [Planctomycetota bacterium]